VINKTYNTRTIKCVHLTWATQWSWCMVYDKSTFARWLLTAYSFCL